MVDRGGIGTALLGAFIIIAVLMTAMAIPAAQAQTLQSAIPATGSSNTAQSVCGATYTVVRGDTLTGIAQRCGVTVSALIAANPFIYNPNIIYPGWVVNHPRRHRRHSEYRRSGRSGEPDQRYARHHHYGSRWGLSR